MHIGSLAAHGVEKGLLIALARQLFYLNGIGIRRESANEPFGVDLLVGIGRPDGLRDRGWIIGLAGSAAAVEPHAGRGDEPLGFSGDISAATFGDSYKPLLP